MIKEMSFWKWLGLLAAAFLLSMLMYGFAGMVDLAPHGWVFSVVCLVVSAAMVLIYSRFVILFEGEKARDLPMDKLASHTGLGLGIGLGYFCVVTGLMALLGGYAVVGTGAPATELVSMFCYFCIVAVGEEIMFRGVLFRWIDEKWGFWAAIIVSALFFGIIHISNPGGTLWSSFAIAIEAGLLLGAAYKWAGTLWLPIGIHWAWNYSQGNIFGFAVSGQPAGESLLHAQTQGSDWLTGGVFGAEASVVAVVVGLLVSAWFIWRISKR
ncbi:MAG: CPBP family intramembrane metalloprotease [Bacteroidales bacterium]|nr:CPBP family intramembrane metalloprotease [Bacteroidales bacterium]